MPSMNSPGGGLIGDQRPRHSSVPEYKSSTGEEAIELCALAGLELDPWQQWCLTQMLGERDDGKWAAFSVGIIVPRQNGKNVLLEARELVGLFLLGERTIIHTAHQDTTAMESFNRLAGYIENCPALSRRMPKKSSRGVVRSRGDQRIQTADGARVIYRSRTGVGGKGLSADCLIFDEAQILPEAFVGVTLPVLSTLPNPQVIYTANSVDQQRNPNGRVLARIRARGHAGDDPGLFFAEWCAADSLDDLTPEMLDDHEVWARANPNLGDGPHGISLEYVTNERREFRWDTRGFAVERLGAGDWPSVTEEAESVLPMADWAACSDPDSEIPTDNPVCLAFDVSPDRSAAIAVAGKRADGLIHIEITDHEQGTQWLVPRLVELVRRYKPRSVVCDAGGPAGSMLPQLERYSREVRITEQGSRELAQACGLFLDAVKDHDLRHLDTDELNLAVGGVATRTLGEAFAWTRRNSLIDICPLVACTLAFREARAMGEGVMVASSSEWLAQRGGQKALEEMARARNKRMEEILKRGKEA